MSFIVQVYVGPCEPIGLEATDWQRPKPKTFEVRQVFSVAGTR
jgi:hypothetical protein